MTERPPASAPPAAARPAVAAVVPIALYLLAVVVRLVLVALYPWPGYPDSAYYVEVARALHAGQGLNVDFIWIFAEVGGRLPAHPTLPVPSNAHWLPLASFVQLPTMALLGDGPLASDLPFALIGALSAPLTWKIARDAGASPSVALWAGIIAAVPGMLLPFMGQPDNFALYQPLGAAALWLTARGMKGDIRSFALAGLMAGLASLARSDGTLLVVPIALAFLWTRRRGARRSPSALRPVPIRAAVASAALYLLVMGPWWARQVATFGSISPSAASGRALGIRTMAEWDSISTPAGLDHLLGQGLGPLLASRVLGLVAAVGIFAVLVGGIILVPVLIVGIRRRWRSADFGPAFVYALGLFGAAATLFSVHVPGGMFIHSACALAPHAYILSLEGVVAGVGWIAARRSTWDAPRAARIFVPAVSVLTIIAGATNVAPVQAAWSDLRTRRLVVAAALDEAGAAPSDVLMSIDAMGFHYLTGLPGVVIVNDPLDTIREVAVAYDARWIVIERSDTVASLEPVLDGRRPDWIGPPILTLPDEADGGIAVGVYPVCTAPGDPRCATLAGARK